MTRSKPSSPPPVNPIHLAQDVHTFCGIVLAPSVKRTRSAAKATCATCLAITRAADKPAPPHDLPIPRPCPVLVPSWGNEAPAAKPKRKNRGARARWASASSPTC